MEASDLDRRADLVGKVVSVDDRVRFYQFHPARGMTSSGSSARTWSSGSLRSSAPESSPRPMPVIVQGKLIRDGGQLVCEVTSLKVLPNDLEPARPGHRGPARERFREPEGLGGLGRAPGQVVQARRQAADPAGAIDPGRCPPHRVGAEGVGVDAPGEWLRLAEEGRRKHVDEPYPSASAHKAFQARLNAASKSDDVKEVLSAIERFFPQASATRTRAESTSGRREQAYATDPAGTYRSVPAHLRKALDRRLWADALQRLLEKQAAEDPRSATALSQRAEAELPERPKLATDLLERGLAAAQQRPGLAPAGRGQVDQPGLPWKAPQPPSSQ